MVGTESLLLPPTPKLHVELFASTVYNSRMCSLVKGWARANDLQVIWKQDKSTHFLPQSPEGSKVSALTRFLIAFLYVLCFLACQEADSMLLTGECELSAEAEENRR